MFLWGAISFGLFGGGYLSTNSKTRSTCRMLLTAWVVASVLLMMTGQPNHMVD